MAAGLKQALGLSEAEISQVVEELMDLEGAMVQRAWSPRPGVAVLALRLPGRTHLLLLAAEPPLTRLHLVSKRPRPEGEPTAFQHVLRAEIEGLRLLSCAKVPGDRIVRLSFSGRYERSLIAELTGLRANLHLLGENDEILHSARPRRRGEEHAGSEGGSLAPSAVYHVPPPPPASASSRISRFPGAWREDERSFPVSEAMEAYFEEAERAMALEEQRRLALRSSKLAAGRVERALQNLDREARRAEKAGTYRRYGQLLKTALHEARRGLTELRVTDWYEEGQPQTTIPLRPELSPMENMERYFRLARRLGSAGPRVKERREELLKRRRVLAASRREIESADSQAGIAAAAARASGEGVQAAKGAPSRVEREQTRRSPYRRYHSATGRPILVGRGSADNDTLTFKVARGKDVWVHVRGTAGSHVVVPVAGLGEPDEQTLLDAATLAAHFSRARGETLIDVAWTHRKHVRKPKGAAPGVVTVSQEKGLMLRLEEARLRRLLESE